MTFEDTEYMTEIQNVQKCMQDGLWAWWMLENVTFITRSFPINAYGFASVVYVKIAC